MNQCECEDKDVNVLPLPFNVLTDLQRELSVLQVIRRYDPMNW